MPAESRPYLAQRTAFSDRRPFNLNLDIIRVIVLFDGLVKSQYAALRCIFRQQD
jgi:hypothetical protein